MTSKKKLKRCLCSKCRLIKREVNGVEVVGCMIELRIWKTHAADDKLHANQEEHLYYATFAASFADTDTNTDSVPVRPRDLEDSIAVYRSRGTTVRFKS